MSIHPYIKCLFLLMVKYVSLEYLSVCVTPKMGDTMQLLPMHCVYEGFPIQQSTLKGM